MAQGSRSSRPKTTCCRCRRRADGVSRLTNLGWLCDHCYDLLNRSPLGRRLFRLVYQFSGREADVEALPRRPLTRAGVSVGRETGAREAARTGSAARDPEAVEVLAA